MIKHIVMWTLKDHAEGRSKQANASLMKDMLEALADVIPEIVSLEVGLNMAESEAAYDIVLVSSFNSRKDLDTYQVHPAHEQVKSFVAQVREKRAVVDYEV